MVVKIEIMKDEKEPVVAILNYLSVTESHLFKYKKASTIWTTIQRFKRETKLRFRTKKVGDKLEVTRIK